MDDEPAPPVICKKGKCAPYDPTKDRVRNRLSKLKRSFFFSSLPQVLQGQVVRAERQRIAEERQRILKKIRAGELPADTVLPQQARGRDS